MVTSTEPCIQEYIHTTLDEGSDEEEKFLRELDTDEGTEIGKNNATHIRHFRELANRSEGFCAETVNPNDIVHFAELLNQPSSIQGKTDAGKYVSLALETQTLKSDKQTAVCSSKNISRLVLVNELGERLLDTLVSP